MMNATLSINGTTIGTAHIRNTGHVHGFDDKLRPIILNGRVKHCRTDGAVALAGAVFAKVR